MVLVPIVDVFFFCAVLSSPCAVGASVARAMLASDDEVAVVAIHFSRLRSILELGAIVWGSTLSLSVLSCFVNKAYSPDEVVCVEVVLWRWWVWSVEIEGVLRVR